MYGRGNITEFGELLLRFCKYTSEFISSEDYRYHICIEILLHEVMTRRWWWWWWWWLFRRVRGLWKNVRQFIPHLLFFFLFFFSGD